MTNSLYSTGLNAFLLGGLNWTGGTFRAFLVTSGYTPNLATDQYLSAISTGNRMGNSGSTARGNAPALSTSAPGAGVADATAVTWTAVPNGVAYNSIVIFEDDGVADASSPLVAYIDGLFTVTVNVTAATSATALTITALPQNVDNGTVFTKVSGAGPATFTLSSAASAGAFALACTSLGSPGITAGAVYSYESSPSLNGLPFTSNGNNVTFTWAGNKVFTL